MTEQNRDRDIDWQGADQQGGAIDPGDVSTPGGPIDPGGSRGDTGTVELPGPTSGAESGGADFPGADPQRDEGEDTESHRDDVSAAAYGGASMDRAGDGHADDELAPGTPGGFHDEVTSR